MIEEKTTSDKMTGCAGFRKRRNIARRMNEYETNCMIAEKEFNNLDNTAQYSVKVEPLKYCVYLFLGILCLLISILIIVHMFCFLLLKVDGKPVHPFLNNFLEKI